MDQDYRFSLDHLISKYKLEPTLRDLYVEGQSDRKLVQWFFSKIGITNVDVFDIDSISIPSDVVSRYSLTPGNRSEVIALALEIEKSIEENVDCVYYVADSDFDFILGCNHHAKRLLYTDFTSLDMYFCTKDDVEKVLMVAIGKKPKSFSTTFNDFLKILEEIFLIRAANIQLGWGCRVVPFIRSCKFNGVDIEFDYHGYLQKVLQTEAKLNQKEEFEKAISNLRNIETKSYRHRIRGFDFIVFLGWYVSKIVGKGGSKYQGYNIMRAIVAMSADAETLVRYDLFEKLTTVYS